MANIKDYSEFNLALDRLMRVSEMDFKQPAVPTATIGDTEPQPEGDDENGTGRLAVQVTMASGSLPITDAKVTVMQTNGDMIAVRNTNNSGRITPVELPAPDARLSQTPGGFLPYSTYNIRVEKPGFYTEEIRNIAVFDRIESIQPVSLEPLGENSTEDDKINIITETAPMQQ